MQIEKPMLSFDVQLFRYTALGLKKMNVPHIFVINLARSTDRRARMEAQFEKLGISDYTIWPAVEGASLSLETCSAYDGKTRRLFFGRDLTASEVGCLLSHRSVYEHMAAQGIDKAIVLEDDCVLSADFTQVISAVLDLPVAWDIVRFISRQKVDKQSISIARFFKNYAFTRVRGYPGGAYAYLLSNTGAKKLLRKMQKNWVPVDTLHGQVLRTGLRAFGVLPSPVSHYEGEDSPSLVGHQRFDKTPILFGNEKYLYPLTRFLYKTSEIFLKRLPVLWWSVSDLSVRRKIDRFLAGPVPDAAGRE